MFSRSKALLALASTLLITVVAVEADAGDRMGRHHPIVKRIDIRTHIRVVDRNVTFNIERHRPRHRVHRGLNTYSGDVAVYYRRGVGTWSYGTAEMTSNARASNAGVRIIDLQNGRNDCSMEKGVCVIRP